MQVAGASVHWYGKAEVALQRKIGHVTITASDRQTALASLSRIDSEAEAALSTSTGRPSLSVRAFSSLDIVRILVAEAGAFVACACGLSIAHLSIVPLDSTL